MEKRSRVRAPSGGGGGSLTNLGCGRDDNDSMNHRRGRRSRGSRKKGKALVVARRDDVKRLCVGCRFNPSPPRFRPAEREARRVIESKVGLARYPSPRLNVINVYTSAHPLSRTPTLLANDSRRWEHLNRRIFSRTGILSFELLNLSRRIFKRMEAFTARVNE